MEQSYVQASPRDGAVSSLYDANGNSNKSNVERKLCRESTRNRAAVYRKFPEVVRTKPNGECLEEKPAMNRFYGFSAIYFIN